MLTTKKRLYAEARELGMSQKDSAIEAGYKAQFATTSSVRLERDEEIINYRKNLRAKVDADLAEPETIPMSVPDEEAARMILRGQLHSDDEKIAQGAAKILLDAVAKARKPSSKKEAKKSAAKQASAGRFGSIAPPQLKQVK